MEHNTACSFYLHREWRNFIHFADGDPAWSQATLPVKIGGLGIRSTVQLVSSAFLASAVASSNLIQHIWPTPSVTTTAESR